MGMYTKFYADIPIRVHAVSIVEPVIRHLLDPYADDRCTKKPFPDNYDHPFFKLPRAESVLIMAASGDFDTYMVDFDTYAANEANRSCLVGNMLHVRSEVNYGSVAIIEFLEWLMPYIDVDPGKSVGWLRYEEYWAAAPIVVGQPISTGKPFDDYHSGGWFGS